MPLALRFVIAVDLSDAHRAAGTVVNAGDVAVCAGVDRAFLLSG
jgi:hypothetical protein